MVDGLQQQVDEYPQLLSLAAGQEAQDDGGASGGARLSLELAAPFAAQASIQDPEAERVHGLVTRRVKTAHKRKPHTSHLSAAVERDYGGQFTVFQKFSASCASGS